MTKAAIQEEYERRLGGSDPSRGLGWSLMYSPEENLKTAKVVIFALNPGGNDPAGGEWDYRGGVNAYVDESWGGAPKGSRPLQVQVRALIDATGVDPAETFAANIVPFRSRSWRELADRDGALKYSRAIWTDLLPSSSARLFLAVGKQAGIVARDILGAKLFETSPAAWERQTIERYHDKNGRILISLPHLSRYKLFSRDPMRMKSIISDAARSVGLPGTDDALEVARDIRESN